MRRIMTLAGACLIAAHVHADEGQMVSALMKEDRIIVGVNGVLFTEYLFGTDHKYPFFYPVNGPASERSVTAWDQEPFPHQSSLYVSLDHVRSENVDRGNYWQPRHNLATGQVFSRNARILEADGRRVVLADQTDWVVPATDSHQLRDTRRVTIWAPSSEVRIMDFEIELEAMKDIEIGQTGHSFLSARMRPEIAVGSQDGSTMGPEEVLARGTGTIVDSAGNRNETGIRGKVQDWAAYYGENNGAVEGLAIIQHSGNPFYPSEWFIRDYGFMSPTPFAFGGDRELQKGETLDFRYRVVVFTGDHESADIAGWREDFEATTNASSKNAGVSFDHNEQEGRVEVMIRGEHFTTYHYGKEARTPFFWPVLAEGGVGVTRNYPMGEDDPASSDHPHHRSLWLTYGAVNGYDFWHNERIETVKVETGGGGDHGWIRAHNEWTTPDGDVLLKEIQEVWFHDDSARGRLMEFISTLKAVDGDVIFGDSKEGLLAVRIRPEIEGNKAGSLLNVRGERGEGAVYGAPAEWMAYSGPVGEYGYRGVAIFDHPENFRAGYWHVRDYGLAAINPFAPNQVGGLARDGGYTLPKGDSLTLRYGVYVHSGDAEEADLAGQYKRFTQSME